MNTDVVTGDTAQPLRAQELQAGGDRLRRKRRLVKVAWSDVDSLEGSWQGGDQLAAEAGHARLHEVTAHVQSVVGQYRQ